MARRIGVPLITATWALSTAVAALREAIPTMVPVEVGLAAGGETAAGVSLVGSATRLRTYAPVRGSKRSIVAARGPPASFA